MYVQLQCETLQSTLNLWDSVWLPRIHIKVLSLNHINYRHALSCIHYFVWPPVAKGWRFFSIGNREPLSVVAQTSIMLLCKMRGCFDSSWLNQFHTFHTLFPLSTSHGAVSWLFTSCDIDSRSTLICIIYIHCKNKCAILAKYLVTTVAWLSLLCKFYECSDVTGFI